MRLFNYLRAYWNYMKSEKGVYEWAHYGLAILLALVCILLLSICLYLVDTRWQLDL